MNTHTPQRRTLSASVLLATALAVVAAVLALAPPPAAEAATFPTYYSNGRDVATWLDSSGRLQAAWTSETAYDSNHAFELLIARHTLTGAADPTWGTDSLTGAAGVRRIALERPGPDIVNLEALGADDAGNITIAWYAGRTECYGACGDPDDTEINEAVIDRYAPDGSRTARRTVAHYENFVGTGDTFNLDMRPLSDGSIVADELTSGPNLEHTASRILWFGTAGETRASFSVDPNSVLEAASTNGDGRLYVTTDDGTLHRASAAGVDRTITSDCRADLAWRGPLLPVAGPGGSFATVCGSGYSSTGTRGIQVRRYGPDGALTSTITSLAAVGNPEVFFASSGAFDSSGRLWVGGKACTAYSGTVQCYEGESSASSATVSAFDSTQKLAGLGVTHEGYDVDGVRSLSGSRVSYAVQRTAYNGGQTVYVGLLPRPEPPPTCVPAAPAVVSADRSSTTVTVGKCASGSTPTPTGYRVVAYAGQSTTPAASVDVAASATSATVTGLTAGTPYRFRVFATTSGGTAGGSAYSDDALPPFASIDAFTQRQFSDFAGRAPTATELTDWRTRILDGTRNAVASIEAATAFSNWGPKIDPVIRIYYAYFRRVPDTGGLSYWFGKIRSGTSLASMSQTFARSSEFTNTYGALSNRQFVELVYQNVLGRAGDQAGIDFWTNQLDTASRNRGQVMLNFSESSEGKRRRAGEVNTVSSFYGMLRRAPTAAEVDVWAPQSLTTKTAVITMLLGSSSYDALV